MLCGDTHVVYRGLARASSPILKTQRLGLVGENRDRTRMSVKDSIESYRIIDLRQPTEASGAFEPSGARNDQKIAFITAVKDESQYAVCLRYIDALRIPLGYSVEKIAVFGGESMAECYQRAMDTSSARYKIYLHVDTYLVNEYLLGELLQLFATHPRLGLVGVAGATQLHAGSIFWLNNARHCYGRHWEYARPPGLWSFLGPFNRRRLYLRRFRGFVGDCLPALLVDGFFIATQYDVPWACPANLQMGFGLYDHVQCHQFIKSGLEVGIVPQGSVWCIHWGPLREQSRQYHRRRALELR